MNSPGRRLDLVLFDLYKPVNPHERWRQFSFTLRSKTKIPMRNISACVGLAIEVMLQ